MSDKNHYTIIARHGGHISHQLQKQSFPGTGYKGSETSQGYTQVSYWNNESIRKLFL